MKGVPFPPHRSSLRPMHFRVVLTSVAFLTLAVPVLGAEPLWRSPNKYRLLLNVENRGVPRSNSPASVDLDFARMISDQRISGTWDEHTIELVAYDGSGVPKIFDASRAGYERYLLPWRLEKYYAVDKVTLKFVVPDETCTMVAVYFDTVESGLASPRRYRGLVGDGDFFRQDRLLREYDPTRWSADVRRSRRAEDPLRRPGGWHGESGGLVSFAGVRGGFRRRPRRQSGFAAGLPSRLLLAPQSRSGRFRGLAVGRSRRHPGRRSGNRPAQSVLRRG